MAKKIFDDYDKNFKNMRFPFTDDEFVSKNDKLIDGDFDGLLI